MINLSDNNKQGDYKMRKDFGPQSWLYPMPVLIIGTYLDDGTPNAMNAAWGGIYDTNQIMLCLAGEHMTTRNIRNTGAFTVSIATAGTVIPCDYVGSVSANDVPDKFANASFHALKSKYVNAPIIQELPMTLECELIKFNEDGICVGKIVNVSADSCILDTNGSIDTKLLNPIIFNGVSRNYWSFGECIASAFVAADRIEEYKSALLDK